MKNRLILNIEEVFQYLNQQEWCVSVVYALEGTIPYGKGIIRFDTELQSENIQIGDVWKHIK